MARTTVTDLAPGLADEIASSRMLNLPFGVSHAARRWCLEDSGASRAKDPSADALSLCSFWIGIQKSHICFTAPLNSVRFGGLVRNEFAPKRYAVATVEEKDEVVSTMTGKRSSSGCWGTQVKTAKPSTLVRHVDIEHQQRRHRELLPIGVWSLAFKIPQRKLTVIHDL